MMSEPTVISLLSICVLLLITVLLYLLLAVHRGTQAKLQRMSKKLTEILDDDTDEKVMVFTDNKSLRELAAQINRLLGNCQRIKAGYKRSEISSKKMLSNISHDIKTPLTVLLGYLEIMRLHDKENEMLQKMEGKAEQVMDLINQFFTLAKLEAGDMKLEITKVNASKICRENILDYYDILTQKGIKVVVSIPETDIYAQGNEDALNRILFNLLSNVTRYGSDGKYLGLFLWTDDTHVYIDVTDKGKGIDSAFAANVFERLYTMEDSRNRKLQGNGLGLTIAKNLAEQLGGGLSFASTPFVKTTFTVKLKKSI